MAADNPRTPPPHAGGISRRSLLKAGAGAATAGAITTRPGPLDAIEPVAADDDALIPTETKYTVAGALVAGPAGAVLGLTLGTQIDNYQDAISDAIAADEVEAHQTCTTAMESMGRYVVQLNNDLTASNTMAHIEARDGIADEWEAGSTESVALETAHSRIENYYASRVEHNFLVEVAAHTQEIAYGMRGAIEALVEGGEYNRDSGNPWTAGIVDHPTYGSSSFSELIPSSTTTTLDLLDGGTVELEFPDLRIIWDSSDTSSGDADVTTNVGEWIKGHTSETNDLTLSIDGESATWDLNLSIPNVTNPDGEDLDGKTVLYQSDVIGKREDIKSQSQTVVDGYSSTLVGNLYDDLDAGNIDPNDIRGIDGMAQHLGGTEDAYADSYILALMNQLDLTQMDLSSISKMTVGYRGYTGQRADDSSGTRQIFPDARVDSASWQGLLFAESVPSTLDAGATYVCDPTLITGDADGNIAARDSDGSVLWSISLAGSSDHLVFDANSQFAYAGGDDANVIQIDVTTGATTTLHSGSSSYAIEDLAPLPNGGVVGADGNSAYAYDQDGTQLWSYTGWSEVNSVSVTPDGSEIFIAGYDGSPVLAGLDGSGAQQWSTSPSFKAINSAYHDPSRTWFLGTDSSGTIAYDVDSQSTTWSDSYTDSTMATTVAPDGSVYAGITSSNEVRAYDVDGNSLWTASPQSNHVYGLVVGPANKRVYAVGDSGAVVALDTSDGTEVWSQGLSAASGQGVCIQYQYNASWASADDIIKDAYFYDGENSEQHRLFGGLLSIDNMTDQDGNDISTTDSGDVGTPDWGQTDLTSYSEYLDLVDQIRSTLVESYDTGDTSDDTVLTGGSSGDWWPPSFWPSWLPSDPIGAAIVVLLGLAGVNAATSS